jgi:hypothetical protein
MFNNMKKQHKNKSMASYRIIGLLFLAFLGSANLWAQNQEDPHQIHSRLTKIFYWQVADELKLNAKAEKEFVQILEDLQARRSLLLESKNALFLQGRQNLLGAGSNKDSPKFLGEYEKIQKDLFALENDERIRLKKVLSPAEMARFYLVRDELAGRIRGALQKAKN